MLLLVLEDQLSLHDLEVSPRIGLALLRPPSARDPPRMAHGAHNAEGALRARRDINLLGVELEGARDVVVQERHLDLVDIEHRLRNLAAKGLRFRKFHVEELIFLPGFIVDDIDIDELLGLRLGELEHALGALVADALHRAAGDGAVPALHDVGRRVDAQDLQLCRAGALKGKDLLALEGDLARQLACGFRHTSAPFGVVPHADVTNLRQTSARCNVRRHQLSNLRALQMLRLLLLGPHLKEAPRDLPRQLLPVLLLEDVGLLLNPGRGARKSRVGPPKAASREELAWAPALIQPALIGSVGDAEHQGKHEERDEAF
mmetsp:Transcript_68361/g.179229  ORF Transcript_68361/g.179229 Transcript_68361/m.179229 type:complete len:317 (-) Transcript_68361:540-1490(-)